MGLRTPWEAGPFAEPTRGLLARHTGPLIDLLERYSGLVASVLERGVDPMATPGEPHPGNTIRTTPASC